jgi:delta8-fatty-acid desaturase
MATTVASAPDGLTGTVPQSIDATAAQPKSRNLPLLTRPEIAQRITQGALLIIYESLVINATAWAPHHPGGALALLHFVGRDATDEIEAYHSPSALARIRRLAVARISVDGGYERVGWKALTPPIALGLVSHPDGVKGHWTREGSVSLATSILQRGITINASSGPIPAVPLPGTPAETGAEVIRLSVGELEPEMSELQAEVERERSRAYADLRKKVDEAGLFGRPGPLAGYGSDLVRYSVLAGLGFGLYFM